MFWFNKNKEEKIEPTIELMHKILNIFEKHFEKQNERIDHLIKYIKPDTHIKLKGIDEVKKMVQGMIFDEKKKKRDQVDIEKEIQLLNRTGV